MQADWEGDRGETVVSFDDDCPNWIQFATVKYRPYTNGYFLWNKQNGEKASGAEKTCYC